MTALAHGSPLGGPRHGGMAARRAVVRWAGRMFRREWRQQLLVVTLLSVAVTGAIGSITIASNAVPADDGDFGSANLVLTFDGSDPQRLHAGLDVFNSLGEPINTPERRLPASGGLLVGGVNAVLQCDGPDFPKTSGPTPTELKIPFTRAGDQLELSWVLPACDDGIDGLPGQAIPARASVPLSTLTQSRCSIRFLGTVPFDIPDPDPSNREGDHWRGTLSYDATLKFSHRCIPRRNGARDCF